MVYQLSVGWWHRQGRGPLGEPTKRALINAMDRLVNEFRYGHLGLKDLLFNRCSPASSKDRNSLVTEIVLNNSTLADYLLYEIEESSEKVRDVAAQAIDHQTWSADEKVALIRQLLHYLYDVLSTGMVKQVDHKQLTYRSRDMGRHGESSERRRSRSPERSEHSLAHSLLNQPLSARKARIYYGMV
ncbi:hypothetical protein BJY59DRAFT_720351 [Rhodotorula toruloides]